MQRGSLDAVCDSAGCTKGALYYHFGSREGLVRALLADQLEKRMAQAAAPASGRASDQLPFDRDFTVLFLEFVCAAARDPKLRRALADGLSATRAEIADMIGGAEQAALFGALVNGVGIDALIFGETQAATTFDAAVALFGGTSRRVTQPARCADDASAWWPCNGPENP